MHLCLPPKSMVTVGISVGSHERQAWVHRPVSGCKRRGNDSSLYRKWSIFGNFWWLGLIKVLINMESKEKASNLFFLFPRFFITKVTSKVGKSMLLSVIITEDETISTILFSPIILINAALWSFFLYFSKKLNFRNPNYAKWSKINYPIFTLWK